MINAEKAKKQTMYQKHPAASSGGSSFGAPLWISTNCRNSVRKLWPVTCDAYQVLGERFIWQDITQAAAE